MSDFTHNQAQQRRSVHDGRRSPSPARAGRWLLALASALLVACAADTVPGEGEGGTSTSAVEGQSLLAPFPCGITQQARTHSGHRGWPNTLSNDFGNNPSAPRGVGEDFYFAGDPILASADGEVATHGNAWDGYGNKVILNHAGGVSTLYAHMQELNLGLLEGGHVAQGDVIGWMGTTGSSSAPHLHYEQRWSAKWWTNEAQKQIFFDGVWVDDGQLYTSNNCGGGADGGGGSDGGGDVQWVRTWKDAPGRNGPNPTETQVGTLVAGGPHSVECKFTNGYEHERVSGEYGTNNKWLWMELDSPAETWGWVSAYYLTGDKNTDDAAFDVEGREIVDCPAEWFE